MKKKRRLVFGRFDYAAFLSFFVYASGTVVLPVTLVALADDLGFSLAQGGMTAGGALHLFRTVAIVAAMLLCGFVAGRTGKRLAMDLSLLLLTGGLALCAVAPTYGVLLLALLLAGYGEGTIEGLATPFVHDLHPQDCGRYINFAHSFWSVGVMVTVLAGGWLLIMLSCAGIPGCGFFTWLMGLVANHHGLRPAFFLVPACYLTIAAIMAIDRRPTAPNVTIPA